MGAFKIGGRVVGATDGASVNAHGCFRSKGTRGRLGCDESVPDSEMLEKVDSQFAVKILSALATKLDADEMGHVLSILREADLITAAEESGVNGSMSPDDPDEPDAGAMDGFNRRYPDASRIGGGHNALHSRRTPEQRRVAADARSEASDNFAKRYPDAARIKQAW